MSPSQCSELLPTASWSGAACTQNESGPPIESGCMCCSAGLGDDQNRDESHRLGHGIVSETSHLATPPMSDRGATSRSIGNMT